MVFYLGFKSNIKELNLSSQKAYKISIETETFIKKYALIFFFKKKFEFDFFS